MNPARFRLCGLLLLAAAFAGRASAAPLSDLVSPDKRKPVVDAATRLAAPPAETPLPSPLINPFNPPAFGQPDPEELRAFAAAQAAAQASAASARPSTDREFLALIAAKITPSGTVIIDDQSWLIFGRKRLRAGDRLTVTYEGRDYDLELVAIDRTTFTLRLNQEEVTRPIKPAKKP
jgi:hypothetical protein